MRFVVLKSDYILDEENSSSKLDSNTSVNQLKKHYFETLTEFGSIISIENTEIEQIKKLCSQKDVVFASFHESPPDGVTCRLLQHSKGALMLTGGFLDKWAFSKSTLNVVTSQIQSKQLEKLGIASPKTCVFTPKINTNNFCFPNAKEKQKAREKFNLKKDVFHLVFAGRFIANKGIFQLIRTLEIYMPKELFHLTLVGDFEQDFFIYQSNTYHTTFKDYFNEQILHSEISTNISVLPALNQEELRELFWSADCFVYPSFHEDENFGMVPREAILSGVPTIVSDFCGLGELPNTFNGKIKTFPTLGGVRFSLSELYKEIKRIKDWTDKEREENQIKNAEFVLDECDTVKNEQFLLEGIHQLLKEDPFEPIGGWRSEERLKNWVNTAPKPFREAIELKGNEPIKGLYSHGTGYVNEDFSEPHFLTAIQSLYTTFSSLPKIRIGETYRGFWKLVLLKEEHTILEFSYPGPRYIKYENEDWDELMKCVDYQDGNLIFIPNNIMNKELLQELIELGYIVPDKI